ncbi:hypothetical protein [Tepidibacillus fermentans]|uniref:Uncharacterized protein n=1 Tax=Tepidibacillus fermentans TaxID=1281767 RepID=A0A4R3KLJ4_9BACI|nr:hypothetical protein [Tepidibacillus fermentans]TCS84460.1 hypothetical protein EDD72_101124 [Tepidibacillus fermentans]
MSKWFDDFKKLTTKEEKKVYKQTVEQGGFAVFNELIRSFHEELKKLDENGFEQMQDWIELGKELFPELYRFSPTWEYFWDEITQLYQNKQEFYQIVPKEERDGEWQVLFDNPFSTEGIVCHTDKNFAEATYLAAKYQLSMKKAEILKLQKVSNTIIKRGKYFDGITF